jgi:hypothetical protein
MATRGKPKRDEIKNEVNFNSEILGLEEELKLY